MGRGRQKAKQTKVARQLKYFSPDTDYDALQRELANGERLAGQAYASDDSTEVVDNDEDENVVDDEDDDEDEDDETAEGDAYADWNSRGSR